MTDSNLFFYSELTTMAALQLMLIDAQYRKLPKPRIFRDRTSPLDSLDDSELIARYRLPRHCLLELLDNLKIDLERTTNRTHPMSVATQVLSALRFYATGSMQKDAGDLHGISQASVSRCVSSVSTALCRKAASYIHFPTDHEEVKMIMSNFHDIAKFPNVISCVDGTQIAITSPRQNEHLYVCRKGYHSLNVQVICDAKLRFLNVIAKWPGSTHDSFIFKSSAIYEHLEQQQQQQSGSHGWLLGDSGYPLLPYLLTPVLRPAGGADERYNRVQRHTRNAIERGIGVWKMRFRCIHKTGGCLQSPPETCAKIIVACAVLHNICINNNVPETEPCDSLPDDIDDDDTLQANTQQNSGTKVRSRLISERFAREN